MATTHEGRRALNSVRLPITVRHVFGEPYEKDGTTVILAASVMGNGGGGSDKGDEGGGGGFHIQGHPVGAYVIKEGDLRWVPAVDPTRLLAIVGFVIVASVAIRAKTLKAELRAASRVAKRVG